MSAQTPLMTRALRKALGKVSDQSSADDLLFLEAWEREPQWGAGFALRVAQIRRANPKLAAAIRAEIGQS